MTAKYSDYLQINPYFESVVDIDADKRNQNLWKEYIVGDDMVKLIEVLCQSLGYESPETRRSFWINGSYGTGKSYAGIFVKHLLEEDPKVVDDFLAANTLLSKFRMRFAKCRNNGEYLVVWKTGCTGIRSGDMLLIEAEKAICDALIDKFGNDANLGSKSLISKIREQLNNPFFNWDDKLRTTALGNDYNSVDDLRRKVNDGDLSAIQAVAQVMRQENLGLVDNIDTFRSWVSEVIDENGLSKSGIFLIWDEFTEYVAYSDDHGILQQLSEFCKVKPFFTLFIVHRSSDLVARIGGEDHYQLIMHRFHEVEFHLTQDASIDLIASSINMQTGMEEHWKTVRKPVIQAIKPYLSDMLNSVEDRVAEKIEDLCPMHPMTIRLLSLVAENYAAAERTMFRFMKDSSNEDIGFIGYINRFGPDDQFCWLTPEWLWDYFFIRESDFHDKDMKVAEYIRHYYESLHLVESDEGASRVLKIVMLLLAVTSSTKGIYTGRRTNGGISATVDCLELCLAGVMDKSIVRDLLSTLEDARIVAIDKSDNGVEHLQLPFKSDGDSFAVRLDANDKKYTRTQMFSKEGIFSKGLWDLAWDQTDNTFRRMKICVCCAEQLSLDMRCKEVTNELDKFPYKLGLLIVTVRDDLQFVSVQKDLAQRVLDSNEPRLTIAIARKPLDDDLRHRWLVAITKEELANESGQTASAQQAHMEASKIVSEWTYSVCNSKIIAWNNDRTINCQYGIAQLQKEIKLNVLDNLFPYAPENIVVTNTSFKACKDGAPMAGIQRKTSDSQVKNVLNGMADLLGLTDIQEVIGISGNMASESIGCLAKTIAGELDSGKVILGDLWDKLMQPPFGYYDSIVCGVVLGYVFSFYKNGAYSWTDSTQNTYTLNEATLQKMVLELVRGRMTTDYLSSGSVSFQLFRDYVKSIMGLTDVQVANETECWHNMREKVIDAGEPFWALKYLPDDSFGSSKHRDIALEIIDQIQLFIQADSEREEIMANVNELFAGNGKIREKLAINFNDKQSLEFAFRTFLFDSSPDLRQLSERIGIHPHELSDKINAYMQGAIYTWTEEQVKEKLHDVVIEYRYLDALNTVIGEKYLFVKDAGATLGKLFNLARIPLSAIDKMGKPWFGALKALYKVSNGDSSHSSSEEREIDTAEIEAYGREAMDFLKNGKTALSDILDFENESCTESELDMIYEGLKDNTVDTTWSQFEKDLNRQIKKLAYFRNRANLNAKWRKLSNMDSIKDWCKEHKAPLFWIVDDEQREALAIVDNVQRNKSSLNEDILRALYVLDKMDSSVLNDDKTITNSLVDIAGDEFREILNEDRDTLMHQAKLKLGNDMSTWDISKQNEFRQILMRELQNKARREKLDAAKSRISSMGEDELRSKLQAFLEEHPEYCDAFN